MIVCIAGDCYSAGTLIACCAHEIVMSPATAMGVRCHTTAVTGIVAITSGGTHGHHRGISPPGRMTSRAVVSCLLKKGREVGDKIAKFRSYIVPGIAP